MEWYYANEGQRRGPITEPEFYRLIHAGVIRAETLVWKKGMSDWLPYSTVAPTLPPVPEPLPGGVMVASPVAEANAAPAVETAVQYAGFWIRVLARLIDGVILWLLAQFVTFAAARALGLEWSPITIGPGEEPSPEQLMLALRVLSLSFIVNLVIGVTYECFFVRKYAATPGKMALGLKIVRSDLSPLSMGRIIGRYFAQMLSGLTLCIGYLIAAFDREKRTLHDYVCDTRVIKK